MRRLSSMVLALAMVLSITLPSRAELLKNFKTEGSLEMKSFGIDNESDRNGLTDDYRSELRTRLMFGVTWDVLDDVHAKVLLRKNNRVYNGNSEDLNAVQTDLKVDNAFVKIDKVFDRADLTMGRQFYGDNGDLVIFYGATNDDVLTVTAADLVRADVDLISGAKLQLIGGKLVDSGTSSGGANSDTDLYGGEVSSDKLLPKGNIAAYYYTKNIKKGQTGNTGNNTLNVYGLRLRGNVGLEGLGYSAEAAFNGGRNDISDNNKPGYDGNAFLVGVNYGKDVKEMPLRASAEWGMGTNDFQSIESDKRFGIIWGEHTSVLSAPSNLSGNNGPGLQNLKVWDIGLGVNPLKKLGVDVAMYRFQSTDATQSFNSGLSSLGTEYDLILSWKHSDNVTLEANAASFQVGDANKPSPSNSPIFRYGGDIKIKF